MGGVKFRVEISAKIKYPSHFGRIDELKIEREANTIDPKSKGSIQYKPSIPSICRPQIKAN